MSVYISIGRRIPRAWFKRQANRIGGLVNFQENIWQMIKQSMSLAKRKANQAGTLSFIMSKDREIEDLNYEIEWIKITIKGTKEQEEEEYKEAMQMYKPFGKILKKDVKADKNMGKHFKSKLLSPAKVEEAYKKGYGAVGDNNMANKLLEMGILSHIEWIKNFDTRDKPKEGELIEEPKEGAQEEIKEENLNEETKKP